MYQATIYADSPCLPALRKLLGKQRLQWDEDCTTVTQDDDKLPAVKVTVTDFTRQKAVRSARPVIANSAPQEGITCNQIADGRWLWEHPDGKKSVCTFQHDPKADARIRREAQSRIDAHLRLTSGYNRSNPLCDIGNYSPFLKGEL